MNDVMTALAPNLYFEWHLCSQELPDLLDVGGTFLVLLIEYDGWNADGSDRGLEKKETFRWHTDFATYAPEDGYIDDWNTENDWREGQFVTVISWARAPKVIFKND